MNLWDLKLPKGYNPKTQRQVGLFAAQFDDQLIRLKNDINGLTVRQLEWQLKPGMNSVGMLLAHLALVEFYWTKVAPTQMRWYPDGQKIMSKKLGIKDDGLPLKPNGKHPSYLKKYSLKKYISLLDKSRRIVHAELKTWSDKDLKKTYKAGRKEISYASTLYHILEHFASHYGQILLIKHMMKDSGVLKGK